MSFLLVYIGKKERKKKEERGKERKGRASFGVKQLRVIV